MGRSGDSLWGGQGTGWGLAWDGDPVPLRSTLEPFTPSVCSAVNLGKTADVGLLLVVVEADGRGRGAGRGWGLGLGLGHRAI